MSSDALPMDEPAAIGNPLAPIQVLIVDDNKNYRDAFRRNLILRGYGVHEAEDSQEALGRLDGIPIDVIVTDLAMSRPTEGLELIRQVRALRPHLPIIMISAVGTFDEGAEAIRLGACQVISKSRIDEEMSSLYEAIDSAARQYNAIQQYLDQISSLAMEAIKDRGAAIVALNDLLRRYDVPQAVKGDAFDLLNELNRDENGKSALDTIPKRDPAESATRESLEKVDAILNREISAFNTLEADTRQNLKTAELLFQRSENSGEDVDFSRLSGIAFCFAVENEAKVRLRKKLQRFFGDAATPKLLGDLLEANRKTISIFYQQHLLRAQQGMENEATMENFYHTFLRILEHQGRYKPDGLKALGIVLICFGRSYSFRKINQDIKIDNPLDLKGLNGPDEVMQLASLLINLQHYRNPYIHPEISEMIKLSKIRETAIACLNLIVRVQ